MNDETGFKVGRILAIIGLLLILPPAFGVIAENTIVIGIGSILLIIGVILAGRVAFLIE